MSYLKHKRSSHRIEPPKNTSYNFLSPTKLFDNFTKLP